MAGNLLPAIFHFKQDVLPNPVRSTLPFFKTTGLASKFFKNWNLRCALFA